MGVMKYSNYDIVKSTEQFSAIWGCEHYRYWRSLQDHN